jgi:hypothetical protein
MLASKIHYYIQFMIVTDFGEGHNFWLFGDSVESIVKCSLLTLHG